MLELKYFLFPCFKVSAILVRKSQKYSLLSAVTIFWNTFLMKVSSEIRRPPSLYVGVVNPDSLNAYFPEVLCASFFNYFCSRAKFIPGFFECLDNLKSATTWSYSL